MPKLEELKERTDKVFMFKCPHCFDVGIQICFVDGKKDDPRRQIKCHTCKAMSPVCKDEEAVKMMWVEMFYQIHGKWM